MWAKFGVAPHSIPDWLALVGDSADGFPGLAGWGQRSASTVLAHYGTIEAIPDDPTEWDSPIRKLRGAAKLATTLARGARKSRAVQGARDAADRTRVGGRRGLPAMEGPETGVRGGLPTLQGPGAGRARGADLQRLTSASRGQPFVAKTSLSSLGIGASSWE